MKKKQLLFVLILSAVAFQFCNNPSSKQTAEATADNSQTSLDWDGVYRGVLPCADCPGIQTTIRIGKDSTYHIREKYLGKTDSIFELSGRFSWNSEGNKITLDIPANASRSSAFWVGENTLTQLDMQGNKITGDLADKYVLSKSAPAILDKKWQLIELIGKPVTADSAKAPHITLQNEDNRVSGSGGCNSFSGYYDVDNLNRISFSKVAATKKFCMDAKVNEVEAEFFRVLKTADSFNIVGDTLVLNRARMAPLARFKTVSK